MAETIYVPPRCVDDAVRVLAAQDPDAARQAAVASYRRMLENLNVALQDDAEVAREILRDLLGEPVVGQDDKGPWVEIATSPLVCAVGDAVDTFGCGDRLRNVSTRYYIREKPRD